MQRIEVNVVTGEQTVIDLTPEEIAEIQAAQVAAAPAAFALYKTTMINRMTDAELAAFYAGLEAAPLRQRLMWQECQRVVTTDPLFGVLQAALAANFGQARADAILTPEVPA